MLARRWGDRDLGIPAALGRRSSESPVLHSPAWEPAQERVQSLGSREPTSEGALLPPFQAVCPGTLLAGQTFWPTGQEGGGATGLKGEWPIRLAGRSLIGPLAPRGRRTQ